MNAKFLNQLKNIVFSTNVLTEPDILKPFAHDEYPSNQFSQIPDLVVKPGSEEEISAIVKLCSEYKTPIVVRGGGTGLSGGCNPVKGGIVLSLDRLNKLVEADENNFTITVQAGMSLQKIYHEAEKIGLFFAPHPGDDGAFAGGIVATNAGGVRAVKYGTVRKFVLGLRMIMANGKIVNLGGKYIKSSTGYNLLNLVIGSEGTLGIITQVTFALLPKPGITTTLIIPFPSINNAIDSVPAILKTSIIPIAMEFIEHSVIRCAEQYLKRQWPTQKGTASLMIILDGKTKDDLFDQANQITDVTEKFDSLDILVAQSRKEQEEILQMRSLLLEAVRSGITDIFDISVPRSQITGHIRFIHELESKYQVSLPTFGHAADGNVHTHFLRYQLKDGQLGSKIPNWQEKLEIIRNELFADAQRRGGVISGEHGIGIVKRDYLEQTIGKTQIDLMRQIKAVFDPQGILNPGKVL